MKPYFLSKYFSKVAKKKNMEFDYLVYKQPRILWSFVLFYFKLNKC